VLTQVTIRSEKSAGANWVKDMLISWAHGRIAHKALGICDSDDAGTQARQEVHENPRVQSANHTSNKDGKKQHIQVLQLHKPPALLPIFQRGLKLPVALEELFPISVWRHAEGQNWLVERSDIVRLNGFTALGTTFEDYCRAKGATDDELFLLTKCVPMEMKEKFSKYVCKLTGQACSDAFRAFEVLVRKVEQFFGATASPTATGSSAEPKK